MSWNILETSDITIGSGFLSGLKISVHTSVILGEGSTMKNWIVLNSLYVITPVYNEDCKVRTICWVDSLNLVEIVGYVTAWGHSLFA